VTPGSPIGLQESKPSGRASPVATEGHTPSAGAIDQAASGVEDITARVRIREAALKHFAEEGYERATIRAIAHTAGVSHGMLRHHFGSKVKLRSACDSYAFQVLHRLNTLMHETPSVGARSFQSSKQLWRYAARSLADGSPTAAPIFDEMVTMTAHRLVRADGVSSEQAAAQDNVRAALLAAMATTIPLFHEHLSRALGVDILTPEGDRLVTQGVLNIFAQQLSDDEPASVPLECAER
jgi:AcrR family transcriptional regulator